MFLWFYSGEESLRHFSRLAQVYAAGEPCRTGLMREAAKTGLPVVRHPFFHYPRKTRRSSDWSTSSWSARS